MLAATRYPYPQQQQQQQQQQYHHQHPHCVYAAMEHHPGTINPAALNAPASTIAPNLLSHANLRGTKRSRSPDAHGGARNQEIGIDDSKSSNKRSRPMKAEFAGDPSIPISLALPQQPVQTPQIKTSALPKESPSQASPQRSTPGSASKPAVVKALPTVRDHTTDQLGPEGDEYIPRETDPEGETKVSRDGYALDGRKYKCRTFQVPNRGEKLFMLATECARVLGYRDSYLLFNKNRSLYKIIATQQEKDNLIHQDILPYSYRSRQIAIVTARSMFRQFGSRLVEGGRRVRDDYWEAKARKQGFTEEDMAGEKRPGAAKAREAAAAEASHAPAITSLPQGEIIYSNGPGFEAQPPSMQPVSLAPLPMIHLPSDDLRPGGYGNIIRPRQEIAGPAYQDRTQSSSSTDILNQASQAAEYNKQLGQTRAHRAKYLDDYWRRPHEQPASQADHSPSDMTTVAPPTMQSPQAVASTSQGRVSQEQLQHPNAQSMQQQYAGYSHQQNPMASPIQQQQQQHRPMPSAQIHQGSPMGMGGAGQQQRQPQPSYSYGSNQMWAPGQTQPSPLAQTHHNPYQSQMPPPQLGQQQPHMGYGQMGQMPGTPYGGMNRGQPIYQPSPSPSQYNMGPQSHPGQQPGMQGGWTAPGSNANIPGQEWQRYQ